MPAALIAFRLSQLGDALRRLDPGQRALLDLSMRRELPDEEIAGYLRVSVEDIDRRRAEALERLGEDLGLDGREQRDELLATLPDLPAEYWNAQAARA